MLAACRHCGFQLTVTMPRAADVFTCPACAGPLQILSVAPGVPDQPSTDPAPGDARPADAPFRGDDLDISLPASMALPGWQAVVTGLKLIYSALVAALCGILLTACIAAHEATA